MWLIRNQSRIIVPVVASYVSQRITNVNRNIRELRSQFAGQLEFKKVNVMGGQSCLLTTRINDLTSWFHSFGLSRSIFNVTVTTIKRNSWRQIIAPDPLGQYQQRDDDCNTWKLWRIASVVPSNTIWIMRKNFKDWTAILYFLTFGKHKAPWFSVYHMCHLFY